MENKSVPDNFTIPGFLSDEHIKNQIKQLENDIISQDKEIIHLKINDQTQFILDIKKESARKQPSNKFSQYELKEAEKEAENYKKYIEEKNNTLETFKDELQRAKDFLLLTPIERVEWNYQHCINILKLSIPDEYYINLAKMFRSIGR
jgi:hypothetical protein